MLIDWTSYSSVWFLFWKKKESTLEKEIEESTDCCCCSFSVSVLCKNGVRCNEGRHSVVLLHLRDGRWTVPGQTICSCARKTRVPPASFRYRLLFRIPFRYSLPFILFFFWPFSMASFRNVEFSKKKSPTQHHFFIKIRKEK